MSTAVRGISAAELKYDMPNDTSNRDHCLASSRSDVKSIFHIEQTKIARTSPYSSLLE